MADATNESAGTFDELTNEQALQLAKTNPMEWIRTALRTEDIQAKHLVELEGETYNGLTIILVNSVGGREGEGDYAERTFAVRDEQGDAVFYFEIQGGYDSYEGTEWDEDFYIVKPVQVLVTQYQPIN